MESVFLSLITVATVYSGDPIIRIEKNTPISPNDVKSDIDPRYIEEKMVANTTT